MSDISDLINTAQDSALPLCILAPYTYLESIPSNNKNVRTTFLRAFNEIYYHIEETRVLNAIDEVISIFHNSSLLIDDIEDGSNFRRGLPTAHTQYGVPLTINSGNLMYFVALEKAMNLTKLTAGGSLEMGVKIAKILTDEMLFLHSGQGLDIYWRDEKETINTPPSVQQYLHMIMNKTGGLFRLSVRLLELFSPSPPAVSCVPLANLLGIIYQIRDDYLNLVDANYSHMKGYAGEDLIEGKLSLPILHSIIQSKEAGSSMDSPLKAVLVMKDREILKQNQFLVKLCIDYMRDETKSLEFTYNLLKEYQTLATKMILEQAPADCLLLQVVNKLCDI